MRHDPKIPPPILTSAPFVIRVLELKYFSVIIDNDRGELLSLSRTFINSYLISKIPIRAPISSSYAA